jgi:CheY-like chemotaxis protein
MAAKILLLDDEEAIRDILTLLLRKAGHSLIAVANGEQAIAEYRKHFEAGEKFDIVLLDLLIPGGKGGKDIMPDLLTIDPDIIALVASGDSASPAVLEYAKFGFKDVLLKPFSRAVVIQALQAYAPHTIETE